MFFRLEIDRYNGGLALQRHQHHAGFEARKLAAAVIDMALGKKCDQRAGFELVGYLAQGVHSEILPINGNAEEGLKPLLVFAFKKLFAANEMVPAIPDRIHQVYRVKKAVVVGDDDAAVSQPLSGGFVFIDPFWTQPDQTGQSSCDFHKIIEKITKGKQFSLLTFCLFHLTVSPTE